MFESFKIVKIIKKLTDDNAEDISLRLIRQVEADVKKKFITIEEAALMILSISIKSGEIDKSILTEEAKKLVDDYEESMEDDSSF
jgi:hypothetical protein